MLRHKLPILQMLIILSFIIAACVGVGTPSGSNQAAKAPPDNIWLGAKLSLTIKIFDIIDLTLDAGDTALHTFNGKLEDFRQWLKANLNKDLAQLSASLSIGGFSFNVGGVKIILPKGFVAFFNNPFATEVFNIEKDNSQNFSFWMLSDVTLQQWQKEIAEKKPDTIYYPAVHTQYDYHKGIIIIQMMELPIDKKLIESASNGVLNLEAQSGWKAISNATYQYSFHDFLSKVEQLSMSDKSASEFSRFNANLEFTTSNGIKLSNVNLLEGARINLGPVSH